MALLERVDSGAATRAAHDPASLWIQRDAVLRNELQDERIFADRVDWVARAAQAWSVDAIGGVSSIGAAVAESVAAQLGLQLWRGGRVASLLLVDGLVNTGIQITLAARAARDAGAGRVRGLALRADSAALARLQRAGADLEAFEVI